MSDRRAFPSEVRPNTLQGQSIPNTFRTDGGSRNAPRQPARSGGWNLAPRTRLSVPQLPVRAIVAVAVILILVGVYLLNGTP